jgi:hypothetical protein
MILALINYRIWYGAEDRRVKILCIMDDTGSDNIIEIWHGAEVRRINFFRVMDDTGINKIIEFGME